MGLGKTHSIVEALVENPNLSADIFMPTRKLCEEIVERLKRKLAYKKGLKNYEIYQAEENVTDVDGNILYDEYGIPERRLKNEFLKDQVYYADGINRLECDHYDNIMERYKGLWFKKKDLCKNCKAYDTCRFVKHNTRAPLSRIVVATHLKYESFSSNPSLRKWYKEGYSKKNKNGEKIKKEGRPRDFFIVDEDIVLSRCYQPITLRKRRFEVFVSTITKVLKGEEFEDREVNQIIDKIDLLLAQFYKTDKTAIIPPVDKSFEISTSVKKTWQELSSPENQWFVPEYLNWTDIVPNYLDVFENAIRHGFVVQAYGGNKKETDSNSKEIRQAFLPNPKSFDLKRLPGHVFFDGTKIDERFLQHKLKNASIETMKIEIASMWKYKIQQNINSDLPRSRVSEDCSKVKAFVDRIIEKEGNTKKFFIVSSKAIRDSYLQEYINESYPDHHIVLNHYGNLRGFNEAKDCDVAIMLGSYTPSDALEVAMMLELFTEEMVPAEITSTENHLWKWLGSIPKRSYSGKYKMIGEMANAIQLAEHRQAIARTRYLSHGVNFYLISKVPIDTYDPYFPEVETYQYRKDLFPARTKRKDIKYQKVKNAVSDWLAKNNNDGVKAVNIYRNYEISKPTVEAHIKSLLEEGFLVQVEGKKKTYKYPEN